MTMTPDEYMKGRVDEQLQWLSDRSGRNRRWFRRLKLVEMGLAGSVPVLASYANVSRGAQLAVALAGAAAAIVAGTTGLWKHQELWTEYRATAEALKREKLFYLTRTPPYDTDGAFLEFVTRVEGVLSSENSRWSERMRKPVPPRGSQDPGGREMPRPPELSPRSQGAKPPPSKMRGELEPTASHDRDNLAPRG